MWVSSNYSTLWGYYGYGWSAVFVPGGVQRETKVVVETTIYSLPRNELMWAAVTETTNPRDLRGFVEELVKRVGRGDAEAGTGQAAAAIAFNRRRRRPYGRFARDVDHHDGLLGVVVEQHAAVAIGAHARGSRDGPASLVFSVQLNLDHSHFVSGTRLAVGREPAANKEHGLVGHHHDCAAAGLDLFARIPDRERLAAAEHELSRPLARCEESVTNRG